MELSLNWLKELLPGFDADAEDTARRLTGLGLEVEQVRFVGVGLDGLLIAEVVKTEPHPTREQLQLVTVRTQGAEQVVVCGANNVPTPGGLVVLAPLGAHLAAMDLTIAPRKLGGIVSEGMLCAESELGLGAESNGILTFDAGRFAPGTRFSEAFPQATDVIYSIGVTPNRPDALGHLGVARDLAAALGLEPPAASMPSPSRRETAQTSPVQIINRAKVGCPRYLGRVVRGVRVKPSPEWLRWRLSSLGIRPVSNVVDVTNLMLLLFGNPMHAFDLETLEGQQVIIRNASDGETMVTLDDETRQLESSDVVICDAEKPVALAGIMGGQNSEIREQTRDVLLECAYFDPRGVRRTARRLGMNTDSSYRFERGVDWSALEQVIEHAAAHLVELAEAREVLTLQTADGAHPELAVIELRSQRINTLLGHDVDFPQALKLLSRLGFQILEESATHARVRGRAARPDVTIEADLIEEVARLRGLDEIPTALPSIKPQVPSLAGRLERQVRQTAAALGLNEAVTYSFIAPEALQKLGSPAPVVLLKNPMSRERSVLCTSLLPGLLDCAGRALRHEQSEIRIFTVGSLFLAPDSSSPSATTQAARPTADGDSESLPRERLSFAAVLAGERKAYLAKSDPFDVYDAKGLAEALLERLTNRRVTIAAKSAEGQGLEHLHPRARAALLLNDEVVGQFGALHPSVVDAFDLDVEVFVIEIDLEAVESVGRLTARYRPIPRVPAITRDLALEADTTLPAEAIRTAIEKAGGELCESVELFDLFTSAQLGADRRSLAFRIVYRDPKARSAPEQAQTLTDKAVDKQHAKVVSALETLGVSQRA